MRAFDRDLVRGGHYGQRSGEPRKKAEHMAAPTSCRGEESPCQQGAVHTWHKGDDKTRSQPRLLWIRKRTFIRHVGWSAFDPSRTSAAIDSLAGRPTMCCRAASAAARNVGR